MVRRATSQQADEDESALNGVDWGNGSGVFDAGTRVIQAGFDPDKQRIQMVPGGAKPTNNWKKSQKSLLAKPWEKPDSLMNPDYNPATSWSDPVSDDLADRLLQTANYSLQQSKAADIFSQYGLATGNKQSAQNQHQVATHHAQAAAALHQASSGLQQAKMLQSQMQGIQNSGYQRMEPQYDYQQSGMQAGNQNFDPQNGGRTRGYNALDAQDDFLRSQGPAGQAALAQKGVQYYGGQADANRAMAGGGSPYAMLDQQMQQRNYDNQQLSRIQAEDRNLDALRRQNAWNEHGDYGPDMSRSRAMEHSNERNKLQQSYANPHHGVEQAAEMMRQKALMAQAEAAQYRAMTEGSQARYSDRKYAADAAGEEEDVNNKRTHGEGLKLLNRNTGLRSTGIVSDNKNKELHGENLKRQGENIDARTAATEAQERGRIDKDAQVVMKNVPTDKREKYNDLYSKIKDPKQRAMFMEWVSRNHPGENTSTTRRKR